MQNSKIAWCDHTFNPWYGCTKVGEGCKNCYAEGFNNRFHYVSAWNGERRFSSGNNWKQPFVWDRRAEKAGRPALVFCGSMCDIWDETVPPEWQNLVEHRISGSPNLIWLMLTKRPENIRFSYQFWWDRYEGLGTDNPAIRKRVWLGISASTQKEFDERAESLIWDPDVTPPRRLEKWPFKKFLSLEPLIEPVNIEKYLQERTVTYKSISKTVKLPRVFDWVIVGGETGRKARPMVSRWVEDIQKVCEKYNVPFFFKQWGEWMTDTDIETGKVSTKTIIVKNEPTLTFMHRYGAKNTGNKLHGVVYQQFPAEFGR